MPYRSPCPKIIATTSTGGIVVTHKKRAKKIARNISKNTAIVIDEHYIPAFKPSKVFVEKIKNSKKIKQMAPQD